MNDLLDVFQSFRRILCVCPCCGDIMRLSDLRLTYTGKMPKTWLDKHESKILALEKKEETFEEKEKEIRDKSVERGRKKVPALIEQCLCPEFKKMKYDPYDIKALMHPVEFVVFDGMNEGKKVEDVTFLNRKPSTTEARSVLESIRKTVDKKSYDWKVARITVDGKVSFE
jgi:predicted Holliday junction resolvase-like endonuclease